MSNLKANSKADYYNEAKMFVDTMSEVGIETFVGDSFKTMPDKTEGIYIEVVIKGLPAEKLEAVKKMAKLHNFNVSKQTEDRLFLEPEIKYNDGGQISEKYPDLRKGQLYIEIHDGEEHTHFVYDVNGDELIIRTDGLNTKKSIKDFENYIERKNLKPSYTVERLMEFERPYRDKMIPQYKKEWDALVSEFGQDVVDLAFTEGFEKGYVESRLPNMGNYSVDAIKHRLKSLYDARNKKETGGGYDDNKYKHTYMMLGRLQTDNDYFLGHGNRHEGHLWAGNVDDQIKEMKKLWNQLPEDGKPEWLSMEDILEYERKMKEEYSNGGQMYNEHWEMKEVKSMVSSAKKYKKDNDKEYVVVADNRGDSLKTMPKSEFMSFPQNYRDSYTVIFDTEIHKKLNMENNVNRMDDGGLINTEEMTVDKGNPLQETTIQNPDIGSQSYVPKSLVCESVDTVAPVSMLYEMNRSLTEIDREVRGIDDYVRVKLGYSDMLQMCRALSAEQVDAIANAIYQIEKGQALIVGDMTGVGKGRIAAGIIRYAKKIGKTPIFFTEKPNLFSDIYRDLIAIGSDDGVPLYYAGKEVEKIKKVTRKVIDDRIKEDIEDGDFELEYNQDKLFTKGYEKETNECREEYRDLYFPSEVIKEVQYIRNDDYNKQVRNATRLVPFIVNGRSAKTEVKDENGHIIYEGISNSKPDMKLKKAFESKELPSGYDVVLLTYSQVNSPTRAVDKIQWLNSVGNDSIVIMDESHNASGSSQTGAFLQEFVQKSAGVCFLSATFAKRPDNMPIYAMKTAIQDAEMENDVLIRAIMAGGVALQEILSNELVSEGQMLRRERSYEGVIVNYNYLDERMLDRDVPLPSFNLKEVHEAVSDKVTALIRRMMQFQKEHVNPIIEELDAKLKEEQAEAGQEEGVKEAGINNTPIFSGIFNLINQLLLSIKADAVADFAINRMQEGKKVIIGFSNTLESFLDYLIQDNKEDKIKTDFSIILKRRLEKILTYTITNAEGEREKKSLNPDEYPIMGAEYESILRDIERASTGITISPLDRILTRIKEAGYSVGEVTGRKKYVEFLPDGKYGLVKSRRIETANDLFRRFNDNDIDCLLINQSGATGASAQAIKTKKAYVVNYDKEGKPIIPKSLEPKNEVKQRVMIILQAELDINKEVQKRGRINRTGQVFKPIYDYVISAIPAEERLMMMLQKKLKSLDANTTSNQKQSKKLLDVVDFLNVYGDEKVVEFLKNNNEYNDLTGNILKFELGQPTETTKMIPDKAHKVSGRVAILPVEMQSNFYKTVSESYQNLELQLKASGEWNLEVENMDLDAETVDKSAVMVGNPSKKSVFAEAVFLEKCRVNNLRKPYKQSEVNNLVSQSLTLTDEKGRVQTMDATEKTGYLLQKMYDHFENNEKNAVDSFNMRMKEDIEAINDMPSLEKMKKDEKKQVIEEKTKKITDDYQLRIESVKSQYSHLRRMIEGHLKYFRPKRLIEYPLANYEVSGNTVKGICLGIDINFKVSNPFAPSGMTLKIVLPNGMRMLKFPLSDSFVSMIRIATEANYDTRTSTESDFDYFVENWDELTKESQANRVTRFIVTGNILKGYGNADYRIGGKLISYTTKDKEIKKGILLPDDFKITDVRIQIPINKMLTYIQGMRDGQVLPLYGTEVTLQSRGQFFYLILTSKNNPYIEIKNDSDINAIAWETEFQKKSGQWQNRFEPQALKKLLNILWEKYKVNASVTQTVFESLKDQFDLTEREHGTTDGTEELIKKHNEALQEYERSKKFELIDEKSLKKMDDLEKENYEYKKRIAELEGLRRLYVVSRMMNDDIRKRKREAEEAAKQTAQMEHGGTTHSVMEQGGTIDSERRFTDSDYNKLIATEKFRGTWSGYVWEIYPEGGGKVLGKFNPKTKTLFVAGLKTKENPLVEWLQNNSYVSADEYTKLRTGGGVSDKNYEIEVIENSNEKRRWKGIVSKRTYNRLESEKNQGGFRRYDIDLYDDNVSKPTNESNLYHFLNMIDVKFENGGGIYPVFDERKQNIKSGVVLTVKDTEDEAKNYVSDKPDLFYEELDGKWAIKKYNNGGGVYVKEINKIRDTEDDDTFNLVQNSQDLEEIYKSYAPRFLIEKNDLTDSLYADGIGGAFVKFNADGSDVEKIYVFEGNVPELHKPLFEIYPTNTYLE